MKITPKVTGIKEVQAELQRVGSLPRQALAQTAEDVEALVEAAAARHSKSGAMVRAIYKARTPAGWEVGHDLQAAPHALFVHWGTRPHRIVPRVKKALRWAKAGKFHFSKKGVNHPGYKGDPWMVRAASMVPTAFDRRLQALIDKRSNTNGA